MNLPEKNRYFPLLGASVVVMLFWLFSFADPCLLGFLRGGDPSAANPIAITTCAVSDDGMVSISNGDAIVRLAALVLLMGIFGFIGALVEHTRRKRSFAGIAAVGATVAFVLYMALQFAMLPGFGLNAFYISIWIGGASSASLAVVLGAAMAATTWSE